MFFFVFLPYLYPHCKVNVFWLLLFITSYIIVRTPPDFPSGVLKKTYSVAIL
nr:MAG TPA: hypothetical protein [Caudoviricetes sp.]